MRGQGGKEGGRGGKREIGKGDGGEQGEMEKRLGKRDRWKGVIGHHRALGQLFFDILVDTMT